MRYLLLLLCIFSSFVSFADEVFPLKKMVCSGYVVNAPSDLHEGYYYIGVVFDKKSNSIKVYNCLGPSLSYVNEMIKNEKCGYSGRDQLQTLKYKKINNQTIVYNNNESLKLVLGPKRSKNTYQLEGKYHFWGDLVPEIFYQISCKALLN